MINQKPTNAFAYTLKTGFKGLPVLPALGNLGILGFFMIILAGSRLFTTEPLFNSSGEVSGYVSARQKYVSLFFDDEYSVLVCLVMIALCGIAMAICTFNFITSKKQVNVYYSLGITRTKLFLGRYISSALLLSASVFLPLLIMLIANLSALGFSGIVFESFFFYLLTFLVVSLSAFTITATIFACVGTVFEAGVFSTIILFLPDILLYGIQSIMSVFLYGNPYGFDFTPANNESWDNSYVATLSEKFDFLSPVFFAKAEASKFTCIERSTDTAQQVIENPSFTNIILWIIFTVIIALLGIKLFNKRKAEIAGFIGTNGILNTLVSYLAGFFVFAFAILALEELVAGLVFGLLFFTVVHLGLQLLVLRNLKKFVKGLYKLPIGLVAVSLFAVSVNAGFFGFSSKTPEFEKIKSVSVSIVGDSSQFALFGDGAHYITEYNLFFLNNSNVITGEITAEDDIKKVLKAHELIADSKEDERTLENAIQFSYTLKDGTTFKRNFNCSTPEAYRALLYLEESQYFKDALYNLFKGEIKLPDPKTGKTLTDEEHKISYAQFALRDSFSSLNIFSKYLDAFADVKLCDADRKLLLDALYNDLSKRSVTDKYYPDSTPVAFMRFDGYWENYYWDIVNPAEGVFLDEPADEGKKEKPKKTTFTVYDFSSDKVEFHTSSLYNPLPFFVITPDMTETIKVLKDLKLYEAVTKTPDFVSAKISPAGICYDGALDSPYGSPKSFFSRYFLTSYTSTTFQLVDENGNPVRDDYRRYHKNVGSEFDGYVTNDLKDVEKLLRYAYTAYEQDDPESGYFVTFYTSNGDSSLCFIPENKLPSEFKIKL